MRECKSLEQKLNTGIMKPYNTRKVPGSQRRTAFINYGIMGVGSSEHLPQYLLWHRQLPDIWTKHIHDNAYAPRIRTLWWMWEVNWNIATLLIRRNFRADKFSRTCSARKLGNFCAYLFSRTFRFWDFKNLIYGNTNEKQGVGFTKVYLWFFCAQKWRNLMRENFYE